MLGIGLMTGIAVYGYSDRLPLPAQRAVSFLPVKVAPDVRVDADYSVEWRLEMWRLLVPQIPKYLLLGKGYRIDPEELYLASLAASRGEGSTSEVATVAGDYHSGPLSTIIPLGLLGTIAFLWLLGAGVKVLYQNYRYGDPVLRNINTFFLAFFIMEIIIYFGVFGALNSQLFVFTGMLGMSVSINGGVRKPGKVAVARAAQPVAMEAPLPAQA
jgi:O-antigen ligase